MRSPLIPSLVLVTAALALATAAGCYSTAGDCNLFECGTGGAAGATTGSTMGGSGGTGAGTPEGCVPSEAAGPVADGCGVFVASTGDDTALGTKASPVQSLATAILRAKDGEKRIYACGEVFTATLTVDADVTIFGGLDCAGEWSYSNTIRTVLTSDPDTVPLRLSAGKVLTMSDVDVTSADATVPSGSSIAILAESMSSLTLTRSTVTAGAATAGADGESFASTAPSGTTGSTGVDACLGPQAITPSAPVNRCGDIDSAGGSGGISEVIQGSAGNAGLPLIMDNGGAGAVGVTACKLGTAGANGTDGPPGDGAAGMGLLDAAGYAGIAGEDGSPGTTAQGGGGGGGSKGGSGSGLCMDATKASGASGGSGGSGGCGGAGGRGGKPGGSSIGLVSLGATLFFGGEVTIIAKAGGAGGSGSDGQVGGIGAAGGNGGMVPPTAMTLKAGCQGGPGGIGGTGGKGGGGHGGHSLAIAYTGAPPETTGAVMFVGSAGEGGLGDGMASSTEGENGVAVKLQSF